MGGESAETVAAGMGDESAETVAAGMGDEPAETTGESAEMGGEPAGRVLGG